MQLPSLCMGSCRDRSCMHHVTSTLNIVHMSHYGHDPTTASQMQGQGSLALHDAEELPPHRHSTCGQTSL